MKKQLVFFSILCCLMLTACAHHPATGQNSLATGDALFVKGDFVAALQQWQQTQIEPNYDVLSRQAAVYRVLGQVKDALQAAQQAQQLATPAQQAGARLALAEIQFSAGLTEEAEQQLSKARAVLSADDHETAARIALAQGQIAWSKKQIDDATRAFEQAKAFALRSTDPMLAEEITTQRLATQEQVNNGRLTDEQNGQLLHSIQAVHAQPDSYRKAFLMVKQAWLLLHLDVERDTASRLLKAAEQISRDNRNPRLLSYALGYQGQLAERNRQIDAALERSAQAAFAAQAANAPESLYLWEWQTARLLQQQHRVNDALAAYRRAVFNLQSIRMDLGTGMPFREKVSPLFAGFADLLLRTAQSESDPARQQQILREVRDTLEQFKAAELQDYFQDRCVATFKAKSKGLEQVAKQTAVLYPVLLPDRVVLLVGFEEGLQQFVLPVTSKQLTAEVFQLRYKLEKRTTYQYLAHAKQLYQWLIAPLQSALTQHHINTLVLVPDGVLRTIPLAVLHDGRQYLVEKYAVATTPGLSLTAPQPLPNKHLTVLLSGLTQSVQHFPPLPNVEQELSEIHQRYGGTLLKDAHFQLDAVTALMAATPYRIIHIASHGQFDRNPENTFLLTYDGKMTMNFLEQVMSASKFRDEPVELLTLSACQTAVGDDRSALGLAGVAVKAGARSALASLWFINDQASSQLVSLFYQQLQNQQSKAEALRQAQLRLIHDQRFQHASYWAAFLMIGNWL